MMKFKMLSLSMLLTAPTFLLASDFVEGTVMGVVKHSPTQSNPPVFINTYTGAGTVKHPEGQWSQVDVSDIVPADTTAIYLSGNLLITHGTQPQTCNLTIAYRNAGETHNYGYIGQTIEAALGSGQRSAHSTWVPITNGKFEIKWEANTAHLGTWPNHCSYGINLSLVSYLR
ncbi:hypothetical protein L1286_00315 [Pseudoalteromonas sp. SMS1]|uniref:hypothetical protein n=1 Tax=Pseudoalteromonas sp. SMS1 TaxID=2908894 RepID=UPI001F3F860A|nr:hypothetical protein [Pseudoalteromonas sp. SMS1]MCF2855898.1 hypothetical protein [Pseudoalteromonas sp. SMS1]